VVCRFRSTGRAILQSPEGSVWPATCCAWLRAWKGPTGPLRSEGQTAAKTEVEAPQPLHRSADSQPTVQPTSIGPPSMRAEPSNRARLPSPERGGTGEGERTTLRRGAARHPGKAVRVEGPSGPYTQTRTERQTEYAQQNVRTHRTEHGARTLGSKRRFEPTFRNKSRHPH